MRKRLSSATRPSPAFWSRLTGTPLNRDAHWLSVGRKQAHQPSRVLCGVLRQASHAHFDLQELHGVKRLTISGFPKHLLFYRFDDEEVFVLRVVHGARDLERLFS